MMMNDLPPQEQTSTYQRGYTPPLHELEEHSYSHKQLEPAPLFAAPLPHQDARFVAALTYVLGWFSGLLFAVFTRENRYVRFHALQALLFFGGVNVFDIAFLFMTVHNRFHLFPSFAAPVLLLSFLLLNCIAFVGWLVGIVQAYRGVYYRMPVVGDIAASLAGVTTTVK